MTSTWSVTVPGTPVGKGRPRALQVDMRTLRMRTPEKTRRWERMAATLMGHSWRGAPLAGPVHLLVRATFARPGRLTCSHRRQPCSCPQEVLEGRPEPHTSPPDLDNVLKAAADALQLAHVIEDDRMISAITATKVYAAVDEEPGVRVTLEWGE